MKKSRPETRRRRPAATLEEDLIETDLISEDSPEEDAFDEALLPKSDLDLRSVGALSPESGAEGPSSLEEDDEFFPAHGRPKGRPNAKRKRSRKGKF